MKSIVFNSSLPRSGSTLLSQILGNNPDIYATSTSGLIELIAGARGSYNQAIEFKAQANDERLPAFRGFCRLGMQGYFDAETDMPVVVDKSRGWIGHVELLTEILGEKPKIICTVRDLCGILASFEKKWRQNPDWIDPLFSNVDMTGLTVRDRCVRWTEAPPLGLSLKWLEDCLRRKNYDCVNFIKFEELTASPDATMRKAYDFLGLDYYAVDYANVQQVTRENDAIYGPYGDHVIRPEVRPVVDDSMEVLGRDICDQVRNEYGWFYRAFYS